MSGDPQKRPSKVAAMRVLIAWADSGAPALALQALDAVQLLDLDDEDVEALFRRDAGVIKIPFLGTVK